MLFDIDEAIDLYSAFKEMTFDVVSRERNSIMIPGSAKKIREYQKEYAVANEKKYFDDIVSKVIKDKRLISGQKPKPLKAAQDGDKDDDEQFDAEFDQERDDTLKGDIQSAYKAFKDSDMNKTQDQVFIEGLLPILKKNFGLLTPKLDFVFGFKIDRFSSESTPRLSNSTLQLVRVAPGIEHPFLVIEAKGCSSPIQEAENQAIRSGAALVNVRKLLERKARGATQSDSSGPDMTSWVFSCAWVPHLAQIFVNWLEIRPQGQPFYHMNLIESY